MSLPAMLPSTRLAIQVAAAAILSIAVVHIVDVERPYWVVLTAIVVMVGSVGETLAKSWDRIAGTLVGLVAGAAIYAGAKLAGVPAAALLVPAAPATVFCMFVSYRLMVVGLTVVLVFLFLMSGADEAILIARLVDTAIGAGVAALVSLLVLPIPTRQPVDATIDAYVTGLARMVHDSLDAVAKGEWTAEIDTQASILRHSEADLEKLVGALKVEAALIGGGQIARGALTLLPILRGHVDMIAQAAQAAARSGLGPDVAAELAAVDRRIASNLDRVRKRLLTGEKQDIPRLDTYASAIEEKLAPKLMASPADRRAVMTVLNVLLALRRLNRGLRHAMEALG